MDAHMTLFEDISRAIAQLADWRFQKVFWKSLFLAFVLVLLPFLGITAFLDWILPQSVTLPWLGTFAFHGGLLSVTGIITAFLMSFLMFPIASMIIGFFLEEISDAVEARYYPGLPPVTPVPFLSGVTDAMKFGGIMIALNLVALIFYFMFSLLSPFIFWALNGYLFGNELFQLVAARRMGIKAATRLRKRFWLRIWATGAVLAVPLSLPLVSLLVPILAAAVFTHQFHRMAP